MKQFFKNLWQYPLYAAAVIVVAGLMLFVGIQLLKVIVKFIVWSWCLW